MALGTLRNPEPIWCGGTRPTGEPCRELLGKIMGTTLIMAHRKRSIAVSTRDPITIRCACGWEWRYAPQEPS